MTMTASVDYIPITNVAILQHSVLPELHEEDMLHIRMFAFLGYFIASLGIFLMEEGHSI